MAKSSQRSQFKPRKTQITKVQPKKLNKKYVSGAITVIILMLAMSFSQVRHTAQSILDVPKKREPPTFLGLEIPKEVLQRMHMAESQPDKFEILRDWAISEGVTFEARPDGSYVALRDGEEYMLKEPDPELINSTDFQAPEVDHEDFTSEQPQAEPITSQERSQEQEDDFSD